MNERIRDYCLRRGCSIFEVEGGLDYLLRSWERTVADIVRGYPGLLEQQFAGDLRTRQLLHEVWPLATREERQEFENRLEVADHRFMSHTVPSKEPLRVPMGVGALALAPSENMTTGTARISSEAWWLHREPKVRDEDW